MTIRELILDVLNDVRPGLSLGAAQKIAGRIEEGLKSIEESKTVQQPAFHKSADGDVSLLFYATVFAADGTLADLLSSQDIFPAVKHVRSKSNLNLLQAKNVVDLLRQHLGLTKLRIQSNI